MRHRRPARPRLPNHPPERRRPRRERLAHPARPDEDHPAGRLLPGGQPRQALVWVLAPAIGGLLDAALKQFYNRPRPLFRDPAVFEDTLSFPSGHSLASLIAFGLLAYVLVLILPRVWMRVAVVVLLGLLVLSIGFSRAYLGAHYLTDVLGGFAVGGCWLAVCISGLETIRRRRKWLAEEKVSQPELARQEG